MNIQWSWALHLEGFAYVIAPIPPNILYDSHCTDEETEVWRLRNMLKIRQGLKFRSAGFQRLCSRRPPPQAVVLTTNLTCLFFHVVCPLFLKTLSRPLFSFLFCLSCPVSKRALASQGLSTRICQFSCLIQFFFAHTSCPSLSFFPSSFFLKQIPAIGIFKGKNN